MGDVRGDLIGTTPAAVIANKNQKSVSLRAVMILKIKKMGHTAALYNETSEFGTYILSEFQM